MKMSFFQDHYLLEKNCITLKCRLPHYNILLSADCIILCESVKRSSDAIVLITHVSKRYVFIRLQKDGIMEWNHALAENSPHTA